MLNNWPASRFDRAIGAAPPRHRPRVACSPIHQRQRDSSDHRQSPGGDGSPQQQADKKGLDADFDGELHKWMPPWCRTSPTEKPPRAKWRATPPSHFSRTQCRDIASKLLQHVARAKRLRSNPARLDDRQRNVSPRFQRPRHSWRGRIIRVQSIAYQQLLPQCRKPPAREE